MCTFYLLVVFVYSFVFVDAVFADAVFVDAVFVDAVTPVGSR